MPLRRNDVLDMPAFDRTQKEYWDGVMCIGRGYDMVRTGWSKLDFQTRSDDTVASYLKLKKDYKVADIGCAMAYACKLVAPHVREYIGIDYSVNMLEEARILNKDFKNAKFILNDGLTLPFEDDYFDIVFCEHTFRHMDRETMINNIMEIRRVVKPNGGVALQFPMPCIAGDGKHSPDPSEIKVLLPHEKIKQYQHNMYVYTPNFVDNKVKWTIDDPQYIKFI